MFKNDTLWRGPRLWQHITQEEVRKYVPNLELDIEKLEKKLDIAIATLELIERKSDKFDNSLGFIERLDSIKADCQATLYYLKEIDEVGTSMSLADNKIQANTLADNKLQAKEK